MLNRALCGLDRVEDYWKGQKGELGGIIYKLMRESSAQRAALLRGEADLVTGLSLMSLIRLPKQRVLLLPQPALTAFGIKFNTQADITSDVNIRRAVSYAFDYGALIKIYGRAAADQPVHRCHQGQSQHLKHAKDGFGESKRISCKIRLP